MSMQCPHCYKTELHPEATKCHHCGGGVMSPEKAEKEAKGCMAVAVGTIGFFIALMLLVASGYRTNNEGDVIGVIIGCVAVGFLAGGLALSIFSNEGSQDSINSPETPIKSVENHVKPPSRPLNPVFSKPAPKTPIKSVENHVRPPSRPPTRR